jgi:Flp pilus assembly protein TadD
LNNGGDPNEAVSAARRAIDLDRDAAEHYHRLGVVLEKIGDLKGALVAAEEAAQRHPKSEMFAARLTELRSSLQNSSP